MTRQDAAEMAVNNQVQRTERNNGQCNTIAASVQAEQRHFLVPEFKTRVITRNKSFELGYN